MDFMYNFKQAHKDRLEDAGVVRYRPSEGFRVLKAKRDPRRTVQRLRSVLTTLVNLLSK
jgi:hypothetical protein